MGHPNGPPSTIQETGEIHDRDPCGSKRTQRSPSKQRRSRHHLVVEHNYHDHDQDSVVLARHEHRGGVHVSFPERLYYMLERTGGDPETGDCYDLSRVVSWQPHGRCFLVHDLAKFKELLPRYFKLSKIPSFQRQLNLYGFQRLTTGLDKGSYYHELFLRGRLDLISRITRSKVKGTGVRARSNPGTEPNFWTMSWVKTTTTMTTMVTCTATSRERSLSVVSQDSSCLDPSANWQDFEYEGLSTPESVTSSATASAAHSIIDTEQDEHNCSVDSASDWDRADFFDDLLDAMFGSNHDPESVHLLVHV